jgi:hypothetical protein
MSHLIKQACKLRFNERDPVDFVAAVGEWNEDACSLSWDLSSDELRLLFTNFPLDGGVKTAFIAKQ